MYYHTGRFIHDEEILVVVEDLDWEIQDWGFLADGLVGEEIGVAEDVRCGHGGVVYLDFASQQGVLEVFGGVGLELFC